MLNSMLSTVCATESSTKHPYTIDAKDKVKETLDTTVSVKEYRQVVENLKGDGWTIKAITKDGDNRTISAYRIIETKAKSNIEYENFRFDYADERYAIVRFESSDRGKSERILVATFDKEGTQQDLQIWEGLYTEDVSTLRIEADDSAYYIVKKSRNNNKMTVHVNHFDSNGTLLSTNTNVGEVIFAK